MTIHVNSSLTPLHEGTTAEVRVPSLSSVANRFIESHPAPTTTRRLPTARPCPRAPRGEVTDLDALFNTFDPATRKGLQEVIQGSAEQYAGQGRNLAESTEYFGPSLQRATHVFSRALARSAYVHEFPHRNGQGADDDRRPQGTADRSCRTRRPDLPGDRLEQQSLGAGLRQLPVTLQNGNRTFSDLPGALGALRQLVDVSKPDTKTLGNFFAKLTPLLDTATPVVGNFSEAFSKPGSDNDLTEAVSALPALARELTKASPDGVTALKESVPETSFFGPYAPDLVGTLRTFGEATAYYDAGGHFLRLTSVVPDFKLGEKNNLTPSSASEALANLKTGQLRRCPGAATLPASDGSSPFTDSELLSCDPSEVP